MTEYEKGFQAGLIASSQIVARLESKWRTSAQRVRDDGTFSAGWPWRRRDFVAKRWEETARGIEAAANGLVAIMAVIESLKP